MSTEQNKETIRRHVEEIFNKGKLAVADEIISPDYVYHGPIGEYKGLDGFKQMVTMVLKIFPDIHYTIDDMVAEGDKIAIRYTMTGTFQGEFMGGYP
jgi:predicted ester cyclase